MHSLDLSSRAIRISHSATFNTPACAAYVDESRMEFVNASKFNGKSGVAEGSAVASSQADASATHSKRALPQPLGALQLVAVPVNITASENT